MQLSCSITCLRTCDVITKRNCCLTENVRSQNDVAQHVGETFLKRAAWSVGGELRRVNLHAFVTYFYLLPLPVSVAVYRHHLSFLCLTSDLIWLLILVPDKGPIYTSSSRFSVCHLTRGELNAVNKRISFLKTRFSWRYTLISWRLHKTERRISRFTGLDCIENQETFVRLESMRSFCAFATRHANEGLTTFVASAQCS